MQKVNFSIITATFNRGANGLLEECIVSLQEQQGKIFEYEHIIIDDGSTDCTRDLLQNLSKNDSRIKPYFQENKGTLAAIKKGVSVASGEYILMLDDDDVLPKNSLNIRADFIKKNPDVDWFYGKTQWVDGNLNPIKTWTQSIPVPEHPYERMLAENFIQGGTTTFKITALRKINWPAWLRKSNDYFIAMELTRPENKLNLAYIDKVLHLYRWHDRGNGRQSQRSLKNRKSAEERWELDNKIRRLHPPGLSYLASELNKAWRENRELKHEVSRLKIYEEGYKAKEEYINNLQKSRGIKFLKKINSLKRRPK
jgi:glycosyltransferase involved in cell wall biosynthesis